MRCTADRSSCRLILLMVLVAGCFCGGVVFGGSPWVEIRKLLASDRSTGVFFGKSVAIDGHIAIIGAPGHPSISDTPGAVYVFDVITGEQLFKLTSSDGVAGDAFGGAVAISGNIAIIGAHYDDDNGLSSGSAYVFDVTTGKQLFKLVPSDGLTSGHFGSTVGISGNTAVIGSYGDNDNGNTSGSAYVFDVTTGKQIFKLLASDGAPFDFFGISVAMSGNTAVVGASYSDGQGHNSGSAYVFDVTTGEQLYKLHATDRSKGDLFGSTVTIDGNTAVICALADNDNGLSSGSAYVFDVTTGKQLFKLLSPDGAAFDEFGSSVTINGNTVVIGVPFDDDQGIYSGSAYIFDAATGKLLSKLLASDGGIYDNFGSSVATNGTVTIIGADHDGDQISSSGSAYIFQPLNITNQLTVSPDPLLAGQDGTFAILQALPNVPTRLIYSLDGLQQQIIHHLNAVIDIANPKVAAGPRLTDGNGNLEFVLTIPNVPNAINIWFQVVQPSNSTNFVATQILR